MNRATWILRECFTERGVRKKKGSSLDIFGVVADREGLCRLVWESHFLGGSCVDKVTGLAGEVVIVSLYSDSSLSWAVVLVPLCPLVPESPEVNIIIT